MCESYSCLSPTLQQRDSHSLATINFVIYLIYGYSSPKCGLITLNNVTTVIGFDVFYIDSGRRSGVEAVFGNITATLPSTVHTPVLLSFPLTIKEYKKQYSNSIFHYESENKDFSLHGRRMIFIIILY